VEEIGRQAMGILEKRKLENLDPYLAVALGLLAFTRIFTLIAFPHPTLAPDSTTYYSGEFLDFSLVSLSGNASRGWLVPFVYALMPNSVALTFFQLFLSGLAWCFLLISLRRLSLIPAKQSGYLLIVLAFLGSSARVIQHDTSVLSTSITNSIFILLITFVFRTKYKLDSQKQNLFGGVLCSGLLMIQKSSFIPIAITLSLFIFWVVYKRISTVSKFLSLGLLASTTLYSGFLGSNVNSSWQISYSGQTLLWQLGGQSPTAEDFASYLRDRNAPKCLTIEAPYQNIDTAIGKILNACPESRPYLVSGIQQDFAKFVISHPSATVKLAFYGLGASLTSSASNYGNAVSIVPNFVDSIFFGTTTPQLLAQNVSDQVSGLKLFESGVAFWLSVPLVGWIFIAIMGSLLLEGKRREDGTLYVTLILCIVQSLFVVILLPSEWVRQTAPFMIGALISAIVLSLRHLQVIFSETQKSDR
jgi:hypothetical protein